MNWLYITLGFLSGGVIGYWWGFFDGANVQRKLHRMRDEIAFMDAMERAAKTHLSKWRQ